MTNNGSYEEQFKEEMTTFINSLELEEVQKYALRSRWLDQVVWMGGRANHARNRYYTLRLITIIGGVIVPALVSLTASGTGAIIIRWLTFSISLAVALSAAIEEFFRYGDRWRNYRRSAELLKIEGWNFIQMSGPYRRYENHAHAYSKFAAQVEDIIQRDVQVYISDIVGERSSKEAEEGDESQA
jgi:hypothetical protein